MEDLKKRFDKFLVDNREFINKYFAHVIFIDENGDKNIHFLNGPEDNIVLILVVLLIIKNIRFKNAKRKLKKIAAKAGK